jgi:hypothetical protein
VSVLLSTEADATTWRFAMVTGLMILAVMLALVGCRVNGVARG